MYVAPPSCEPFIFSLRQRPHLHVPVQWSAQRESVHHQLQTVLQEHWCGERLCVSLASQHIVLWKDRQSLQRTLLSEQLSDTPAFLFEVNVLSRDISGGVSQVSSLHLAPPFQQCNIQQLSVLLMTCQLSERFLSNLSSVPFFFLHFLFCLFLCVSLSVSQPWDVFRLPPFSEC